MVAVTYPGVYIQEIASGARPITIASTSTAAFVGLAEKGPELQPTLVTSWTEYQRMFGSFFADSYLPVSVFQYFNNGGRQCYVVRVALKDATVASVTVLNRANPAVAGITFSANSKGDWGNTIYLQIENGTADPGNTFKVTVRLQDDAAVVPPNFKDLPPLEVFDNLVVDADDPNHVVDVIAANSNLITAAVLSANIVVQRGSHRGGFDPSLPLGTKTSFQINLDNDGFQVVTLPAAAGAAGAALSDVATAIQTAVVALTAKKTSTPKAAFTGFTCTVETVNGKSRLLLQSGTSSGTSSVLVQQTPANDATALLKLGSGNGGVSEGGLAAQRPALADVVQVGDSATGGTVSAVTPGSSGTAVPSETDFSAAFTTLDTVTDFSLLAVPGESTTAMADLGMAYCANRPLQDVFYIGETGQADDTVDEARSFRNKLTTSNSYGAIYFPWVRALDPSGASKQPILLPPSGYVAGLYARIDATRGPWKAPAGTEAGLNGVVGLQTELSDVQHGTLNPIGINALRRFAGTGVVSFGARTIASDAAWRYVPVRRTAILLRVSIYNGIQWAVFEPNDEPLWSELRLNVNAFMTTLFRQGAFQGSTTNQAFFVKCDGETTTQADIDAGVVNLLVGFAPLKPAEFVVVKISQKAGQASG